MEDKNLSIIVPVYKVEKYIRECVESIRCQIDNSCEIILVDDGSPDKCSDICDDYARNDSRIKVIHKPNGGLASARNAGLEVATGRYIAFVDSDDRIAEGCIEKILKWIEQTDADVCFMEVIKFFPDGRETSLGDCVLQKKVKNQPPEKVVKHLSSRPKYPGAAWSKLYNRSFLVHNDIMFPFDNRISEDLGFVRDCIMCAEQFDALNFSYYEYRQNRVGSITDTSSWKSVEGLEKFIVESSDQLTINGKPKNKKSKYALSFAAYEYVLLLSGLGKYEGNQRKSLVCFLKEYKWILHYGRSVRLKAINLILKLFGLEKTSKILVIYKSHH